MKITHILESRNYLYEGLDASSLRSIKLWESAGRKLVEYEMTADQISKLFGQVQQDATAAGSNRTMIGKGKDAADAVGKAWEDLKTKVANSGPIKNVDAQYDKAAEKLKQATGGDAGVMKYVQKYRDFAKAHPIAQGLIYSALIAAAGISGVGAGGAAALALFKMTDKLLQGEKFSSAAYAGAKTGAMAYGAGQIGKALQGGEKVTSTTTTDTGPVDIGPVNPALNQAMDAGQQAQQAASGLGKTALSTFQNDPTYGKQLATIIGDKQVNPGWMQEFTKQLGRQAADPSDPRSMSQAWINANRIANVRAGNPYGALGALKESQIKRMFYVAGTLQDKLTEGIWDKVKGAASKAAGAVANKAQTVGTNLTTKVTADKLMTAWKRAGSPTDSDAVAAIMKQAGVDDGIIASSMKAVGGQTTPTPVDPTKAPANAPGGQQAKTGGTGAFGQMANQLAPADAEPAKPVDAQTQKFIQQLVASYTALTPEEKAQLKRELEDAVTASDVGSNVVKATNENKKFSKRVGR